MEIFELDSKSAAAIKISYIIMQFFNIIVCAFGGIYLMIIFRDVAIKMLVFLAAIIIWTTIALGLNVVFGMFYDIRMIRICAENGRSKFQPSVAPSEAPTVTPSASTNNSTPNPTTWKCLCGNVNPNYKMYCECGKSKEDFVKFNNNKVKVQTSLLENGGWKCDCGIVNAQYVTTCGCGRNKREVLASRQNNK